MVLELKMVSPADFFRADRECDGPPVFKGCVTFLALCMINF